MRNNEYMQLLLLRKYKILSAYFLYYNMHCTYMFCRKASALIRTAISSKFDKIVFFLYNMNINRK